MAQFNTDKIQTPSQAVGQATLMPQALRLGQPVGPRLVGGTTFIGKSGLDSVQVQILAQACLQGLDAARQVVFGWQRQGQSLADIYVRGIAPCARLVGEWWSADRLDFGMTTIVSTHLQQLLYDFSAEFLQEAPQPRNGWSLLLMTEPAAQHSMGLFMLSEFFKQAGWAVTLGVPQDVAEFKRLWQADWFDAVGVSVSSDRHIETLGTVLTQLKGSSVNLNVRLFVGGPMALLDPSKLAGIPAEVVALDAIATVQRITQSMSAKPVQTDGVRAE
ncbi:B12-binding domain-containing protein [Limnohabitans sp.]|uniref:cobalamin B12-binding domain-containing protein n=1 Tax=Limnohabitans sp. TaxID=1907725 RepID=UPI0038B8E310